MNNIARITIMAVAVLMWTGCNKPTTPEPVDEPTGAQETEQTPPVVAEEEEQAEEEEAETPDMAVAKKDVERAAELYRVLHNDNLGDDDKENQLLALMERNGWDEDAYLTMVYDITQDPVSRAYYIDLLQQ